MDIPDLKAPKIVGNLVRSKAGPENPDIKVPFSQITDPAMVRENRTL